MTRSDDVSHDMAGRTIGLFIDGGGIGPSALQPIVDALEPFGVVSPRRIYVERFLPERWGDVLERLSIEPQVVSSVHGGSKDPADIALAWDVAMGVASGKLSGVAIASEDVDFAWVHKRVRSIPSQNLTSFALLREKQVSGLAQRMEQAGSRVVLYRLPAATTASKKARRRQRSRW